jgi:preprotein translocase subunit YajC
MAIMMDLMAILMLVITMILIMQRHQPRQSAPKVRVENALGLEAGGS